MRTEPLAPENLSCTVPRRNGRARWITLLASIALQLPLAVLLGAIHGHPQTRADELASPVPSTLFLGSLVPAVALAWYVWRFVRTSTQPELAPGAALFALLADAALIGWVGLAACVYIYGV